MKKYSGLSMVINILLLTAVLLTLSSCRKEEYDPHEGMVQVPNGAGDMIWIVPEEELEVSAFKSSEFVAAGKFVDYVGHGYTAKRGIDVSEHQLEIDWQAVAGDGIEFAVIRAGYRGYSSGGLNEDRFFRQNIQDALAAGIEVGIYFFSQAVSKTEAAEEARYLLTLIEGYEVSLPVFFDWEPVDGVGETRTDTMTDSITDCCLAFSEVIAGAGYEPGVYFYRSQGYHDYELGRLSQLVLWSAAPGAYPDLYYAHDFWQYSYTAKVAGIEPDADLDLMFVKIPEPDLTQE